MIDPITMSVLSALAPPAYSMVCSVPTAPVQDAAKAADRVDEIIAEHQEKYQEWVRRYRSAETDEDRQAVFEQGIPSAAEYFDELREIAVDNKGTEAAGKAAAWVLQNNRGTMPGQPDPGAWAIDVLLADFMDTQYITDVPMMLSGLTTKNAQALDRIRKEAPSERARALASYNRGSQLLTMSKVAREIAEPGSAGDPYLQGDMRTMDDEMRSHLAQEGMSEKYRKLGEELLELCTEEYGDVEMYPGFELSVADRAKGELFEQRNLQIGMVAPDITGTDAEGVEFKLSDYRGQVVLLDFWGFW